MSQAASQQAVDDESTVPEEEAGTSRSMLSRDDAFQLLSNERRRYTLHYLKHSGPRVELGDLAEHVASWENETPLPEIGSTERKRVYTSLQSHHLPKMADQGIVDYDDRSGAVELTERADELDIYLEVVDGYDVPWSQYYLGLSVVNGALLTGVAAGVWPLTLLPTLAWAAFVVTTVIVSALVHVYHDSSMRLGADEKPPEVRS